MQVHRSVQLFGDILVKAPHPITVINPDEWFKIHEIRIELEKIWVRGENTCWFNLAQCERTTVENLREEKWLESQCKKSPNAGC